MQYDDDYERRRAYIARRRRRRKRQRTVRILILLLILGLLAAFGIGGWLWTRHKKINSRTQMDPIPKRSAKPQGILNRGRKKNAPGLMEAIHRQKTAKQKKTAWRPCFLTPRPWP